MEEKKKLSKGIIFKRVMLWGVIPTLATAFTIGTAIILGNHFFGPKKNYEIYNISDAEDDYDALYTRYQKADKTRIFNKFKDYELANISLLRLREFDNFYSLSNGLVVALGIKQTISATYIKDHDNYFEENLSHSLYVSAANRFYQNEEGVKWYKGKYISLTEGNYSDTKLQEYTHEEFEDTWGRTLARGSIYIISSKTYINGNITKNSDDTYDISLNLNPTYSVLRYVKQMVMTGNLDRPPVFHNVELTLKVNNELQLLSLTTNEIYDAHMFIDAKNSKASLTQTFYYSNRSIPGIDEKANYNVE